MIKFALISHFILWGGVSLDIVTTWRAPQFEANPILGTSRVRQGVIVIGSTAALDLVSVKVEKHHPKLAIAMRTIVGAEHTIVGLHNMKALHQ